MRRRLRLPTLCFAPLLLLAGAAHAQTFRDPMRPPGTTPARSVVVRVSTLKLEGVISGAVRVAIINGRLVRAGDEVAGARIVEVLAAGVRYTRAGREQTLMLPGAVALSSVRLAHSPEATKP
jgi:MSHA biogenesis protein MshK